jgi:lysozyme
MITNSEGIALIKQFEGLSLRAYQDTGRVWTIGYGHTNGVFAGMIISKEEAEEFFQEDLHEAEAIVQAHAQVPLTGNQFSALVAFIFNVGYQGVWNREHNRPTIIFEKLNKGDYQGAANQLDSWIHDNGRVVEGLKNRRAAEKSLFLKDV